MKFYFQALHVDLYRENRDTVMSLYNTFTMEHENKIFLLLYFLGMGSCYIYIVTPSNIYPKKKK